jgi:dTMP kinase
MKARGLFISFEGGEGSGKTTQINRLAGYLSEKSHKVITTREPGGTPEGEKIRELLVQRGGGDWTPMAECLLFCTARVMLVEKTIRPALEKGKVVISDRFSDSTFAYQGYGRGFAISEIEKLNRLAIGDFKPDLTFVLDIEPSKGLARSNRRLAAESLHLKQTEDRFENLDIGFHERLRAGYLAIAKKEPKRCHVIDASQDLEKIAVQIATIVTGKLK